MCLSVYYYCNVAQGLQEVFCNHPLLGITPGTLMQGVRFFSGGARTQSLVISSLSKTARFVDTVHMFGAPKNIQLH